MDKRKQNWLTKHKPEILDQIKKTNPRIYEYIKNNTLPEVSNVESSYLYGPTGTGKTTQAVWYFLEWTRLKVMKGKFKRTGLFISFSEFIEQLRRQMFTKEQSSFDMLEHLKTVEFLVLDDLLTVKMTDWAYQCFANLVFYRYDFNKPTIYTSNVSLQKMGDVLQDDRIIDRIRHQCKIIKLDGESKRKK